MVVHCVLFAVRSVLEVAGPGEEQEGRAKTGGTDLWGLGMVQSTNIWGTSSPPKM